MKHIINTLFLILFVTTINAQEIKTKKEFYNNGQLQYIGKYKMVHYGWGDATKEVRLGEWKSYHKNGKLESIGSYENGSKIGVWKYYYANGKTSSIQSYLNSRRDGHWKSYYKNGQLEFEKFYDEGNNIGLWLYYDENGSITKKDDQDLLNGLADKIDGKYDKAFKWFKLSAERGNSIGQYWVGWSYFYGAGIKKSYISALSWYKKSATSGNEYAQFELANMYYHGQGVEKNLNTAFYWFKKSAEQDYNPAALKLGLMYLSGEGGEKNSTSAFNWIEKSANWGNANAGFSLGTLYESGTGVTPDQEKAIYWYRKAINIDPELANAYYNLGAIYVNKGVAIQEKANKVPEGENDEHNRLMELANAEFTKGVPYLEKYLELKPGDEAIEDNLKSLYAILKIEEPVDNGESDYQMGRDYAYGRGVERDYNKAFYYYKRSAERGHPEGQNYVGWYYAWGESYGIEQNQEKAFYWLQESVKNGSGLGMYNLGECYREGLGQTLKKDTEKAVYWYKKSIEKDPTVENWPAYKYLAKIYFENGDNLISEANTLSNKSSESYIKLVNQAKQEYTEGLSYQKKLIGMKPTPERKELYNQYVSKLDKY